MLKERKDTESEGRAIAGCAGGRPTLRAFCLGYSGAPERVRKVGHRRWRGMVGEACLMGGIQNQDKNHRPPVYHPRDMGNYRKERSTHNSYNFHRSNS